MASIDDLLQAKQPIQFPLQVASFVNAFLIQSFRSGTQYLNTRPNLIVKEGIFAGGFRSLIELTKLNSAGLEGDDESKHDLVALCHLAGQHTRRLLYSCTSTFDHGLIVSCPWRQNDHYVASATISSKRCSFCSRILIDISCSGSCLDWSSSSNVYS